MNQYITTFIRILFAMAIIVMMREQLQAQGSSGSRGKMPRLSIVDMPTARILPQRAYRVSGLLMQESGLLAQATYGLAKNVNLGFSYSSMPLFGEGDPSLQPLLLFEIRARLFSETKNRPAIAIGVNTQGIGQWTDVRRFEYTDCSIPKKALGV